MIDPAVGFMILCYAWMCMEWGSWKMNEYYHFSSDVDIYKGKFLFLFHTALAPITGTVDLFRRVK